MFRNRNTLTVFQPIREYAERECLHPRHGLLAGLAVYHHARKLRDLGDELAVVFLFDLDSELH